MNIRKAHISDNQVLLKIGRQTFIDTYASKNTPENMASYLEKNFSEKQVSDEISDANNLFLLLENPTEIVGYAKLRYNPEALSDRKAIEIERFYVTQDFHGQGLGVVLMDGCVAHAKALGNDVIWLGVWEENPRAISFYKKMGFEIFDTHHFVLGDDAQIDYLMKKELEQ